MELPHKAMSTYFAKSCCPGHSRSTSRNPPPDDPTIVLLRSYTPQGFSEEHYFMHGPPPPLPLRQSWDRGVLHLLFGAIQIKSRCSRCGGHKALATKRAFPLGLGSRRRVSNLFWNTNSFTPLPSSVVTKKGGAYCCTYLLTCLAALGL